MTIKITSDSTCDLSKDLLEKYQIDIVPLSVTLGERSGLDGVNITPEDIYSFVEETKTLPHTSAVSIGEYETVFKKWRDLGYEVIHFNISEHFSASYQNACHAAEEVGGVSVVDSANLSTGQALMVLTAAEMAQQGAGVDEIVRCCEALAPRIEASFVVDSTDYLVKGGRCSKLTGFSASLLKIKPCIEVIGGSMTPGKKYHGKLSKVIRNYAEDRLKDRTDIDSSRIFITHTKVDDSVVEDVKDAVRRLVPDVREILETTAGATITTHCGPGTLGILFIRKE